MQGYIHSLQSLGTLDGPGVRAVVFCQGCPLTCIYCHNPDTLKAGEGTPVTVQELSEKILRLYPYIKNGGLTFSGGEPCLQAEFLTEVAAAMRERGLHIALDTSGCIYNERVDKLLDMTDLVLLDIKMTTEEDYRKYTSSCLSAPLTFLRHCQEKGKKVWIRHVVVPGINDNKADLLRLHSLIRDFSCVEKTELLPFRKLCREKYENMGLEFPLRDTPEMSETALSHLRAQVPELK